MSAPAFVDFDVLKKNVTFEQVIALLGLQLTKSGNQWRGPCPVSGGGPRAFVVTEGKGFYSFPSQKGGDVISLVAFVKKITAKEAASHIAANISGGNVPGTGNVPDKVQVPVTASLNEPPPRTLKPLDYLLPEHEAVQALGISADTCKLFGAGYAPKGIMRGRLALPIHNRQGQLLAYCGRAVREESPTLIFPNGFQPETILFNAERVAKNGDLYLCRDPLKVLEAVENGIPPESVVSFLTDGITSLQFSIVSSLMDDMAIETAQLF